MVNVKIEKINYLPYIRLNNLSTINFKFVTSLLPPLW